MTPLLAALLLLACDSAPTPGSQVTLALSAQGLTEAGSPLTEPFVTSRGWSVSLDEAVILVGPVYLYAGAETDTGLARVAQWVFPTAAACATHAQASDGVLLAEVRTQAVVDLLGEPEVLWDEVPALEGSVRAMELHLHPPGELDTESSAEALSALAGHTARLRGSATQGEDVRPFSVEITLPDEATWRIVESIPVEAIALGAENALTLRLHANQWLDAIDFSQVEGEIHPDTQAWTALTLGLRAQAGYSLAEVTP